MASWVRVAGASACALIFSLGFVSCGGVNNQTIGSTPNITGNWEFTATETTGGTVPMGVSLIASGSAVTGTAVVQMAFPLDCVNGCCGGPFAEFSGSLTGTVDSQGDLKLQSTVPNGGPVFTMSAQASAGTLTGGSFTLTGPCPTQGTITGVEFPTLNGTYAGTMTSQDTGAAYNVATNLVQSTTPNDRGFYNVTATASVTGYPCFTALTEATPLDLNSGFLGNQFAFTMNASPSGGSFSLSGALSPDGKTIAAVYVAGGGTCSLDLGTGTLTLQ